MRVSVEPHAFGVALSSAILCAVYLGWIGLVWWLLGISLAGMLCEAAIDLLDCREKRRENS